MTKRVHVLKDTCGVTCVIFSDVPAVNAAHTQTLIALARLAGLAEPITILSTSPIQSPHSLAELGVDHLRVMR